ncbi:MAG: alpha/beta hydrolase [Alphaproteobacteria bacterium]|nr:alpha/beta hydrolase [Alphaproteobacteria bacterium]
MIKQQRLYLRTAPPQEQIHCRYAGDRGPFVILAHQLPLSCRQYERAIPVMGDFCRAYGLDMPGYGSSPPPPGPLTIAEYARRLIAAIEVIGAKTFALVGLEIGVAVAAEIARQVGPGRVSHFVAMAVPPLDGAKKRAYIAEIGEPQTIDGRHALPIWRRFQRRWGTDGENAMLRMAFTENHNVYPRYHWGVRAFADYDLSSALRSLSCPILVLSAEHDPMASDDADAARSIPGARHAVIAGARPALVTTERHKFAKALADFIGCDWSPPKGLREEPVP